MERKAKFVAWAVTYDNVREAKRRYLQEFGEEAPCEPTIRRWVARFLEFGDINKRQPGSGRPVTASGDDTFEKISERIANEPTVSTRQLAAETGVHQSSIVRCLQKNNFHPYKITKVQALAEDDYDRRMEFCQWVIDNHAHNDDFHKSIIFSDEAVLHVNGMVNLHNLHFWATENPHMQIEKLQDRHAVTVWCMVDSTGVIAFDISTETMNSSRYCDVLEGKVFPYFRRRSNVNKFYQQDGAPPHYSCAARNLLNTNLPDRWVGRRGPVEWPPRSPDLTICDFFLWGALRDKVYKIAPRNVQQLTQRIQSEITSFPPRMFESAYNSFLKRCPECLELEGGQVEG